MLEAAEYLVQCVEGDERSRRPFTTREAFAREVHEPLEVVDAAFDLLRWRGLLGPRHDPTSGTTRLLPLPTTMAKRRARHSIADRIAFRVRLGIWGVDAFPTVLAMRGEFRCGLHTLCDALKLLQEQGIVHKVLVPKAGSSSARDYQWRPAEVVGESPDALGRRLKDAILAGELTGIIPYKAEMAERNDVSTPVAASAYEFLRQEGLIGKGWLFGEKQPRWYVLTAPPPEGLLPGETKPLAIARGIIDRMPYWLSALPDGSWARRWLPLQEELKRDYRTDTFAIEQAMHLLVHAQVLEPATTRQRRYVPRPPADGGAAYGLTFRKHKRRKPRWQRASAPVDWLPLPASADDPIVRALDNRLSRRVRQVRNPNTTGDQIEHDDCADC